MSQLQEETEIQEQTELLEQTEVRTSQREVDQEQRVFTFKATQLIWLALGLLQGLIGLRVMLKLIGANPQNPFAAFIYGMSDIFLFPFEGLVGTPAAGGMELEIYSIIAMLVYALLFWALERLVWVIFYRPRGAKVGVTQTTTSEPVVVKKRTTRRQSDM
jgi:YggT family protein